LFVLVSTFITELNLKYFTKKKKKMSSSSNVLLDTMQISLETCFGNIEHKDDISVAYSGLLPQNGWEKVMDVWRLYCVWEMQRARYDSETDQASTRTSKNNSKFHPPVI
jgi:hypothetical protein